MVAIPMRRMLSEKYFLAQHSNAMAASAFNGSLKMDLKLAIREKFSRASVTDDTAVYLGQRLTFPKEGGTTPVLDHKVIRTSRKPLMVARGLEEGGTSSTKQEVVELLSVAVHTLLRPENQSRLRKLMVKNKQPLDGAKSRVLGQRLQEDHYSSPAATGSVEDIEDVRYVNMEVDASHSGRSSSDQMSMLTSGGSIPSTSQGTELLEYKEKSHSIETTESWTRGVDAKGDSSLTGIRRLKVLNVHSYVHNALRESALRSWLNSRTIEE